MRDGFLSPELTGDHTLWGRDSTHQISTGFFTENEENCPRNWPVLT